MKTRTKWRVPLLLLSIFAACILSACGSKDGVEQPPEPEEGVLIYAALNPVTDDFTRSVKKFNNAHEDVQIEVRDYSDEHGVERLFAELALGQVPDIMEMHRLGEGANKDAAWSDMPYRERPADEYWLPYRQMAQKGYLENLWPYIENDPQLGLEGVLMPPLKAAEVNGGLYMIFPDVSITTLMGPEHIVGSRLGWTLDELMETYSTMPEDSTILRYNATRWDVFSTLCAPLLEQYVNMETGESSFDSEGFRDMVEFLKSFPEECKTAGSSEEVRAELLDRILGGRQMLETVTVAAMWYIASLDTYWGAPSAYVGYPTADGSLGSFFNLHGNQLAMSSSCRDKETAWEFMRPILTKTYRDSEMLEMRKYVTIKTCVNLKNYNQGNEIDLAYNRGISDVGAGPLGERLFKPEEPNESHLQRFEALLNNTAQIYWPDSTLSDIVWDTLGPYFAGDKAMDEVIGLVQNRVQLYLNENR